MPRCSECNKFVSVDAEVDANMSLDVDEAGVITGSVELENQCADCGSTLQSTSLEVEIDLSAEVEKHRETKHKKETGGLTLSVTDESVDRTDRYGKGRRAAHFYGAEVTASISCDKCGTVIATGNWSDEIKSSHMDET